MMVVAIQLGGCAAMVTSATSGLADDLSMAILDQDDPKTVEAGAPSYLLLVDGLIRGNPGDTRLLLTGSRLYHAYAGVFVEDTLRAERMTAKARDYGRRALCSRSRPVCAAIDAPYDEYVAALQTVGRGDVPALYTYSSAWAGWIQSRRGDWNAVADLPKVKAGMERVVALDESYGDGGAHEYLGIIDTLVPPALGGRPEAGRRHFERAIELSEGRNLMVKVAFAERYAKLVFDRELHDRLLREVIAADAEAPGLTLINTLAKERAHTLLSEAESYF